MAGIIAGSRRHRNISRIFTVRIAALAVIFILTGCGSHGVPPRSQSGRSSSIPAVRESHLLFRDVTHAARITYRWSIPGPRPINILQGIGNGCAFLDYNNDGNLDILLVGPKLALYQGDGHGHFTNITRSTGLDQFSGAFLGCAVGDYDNDGFDDIYISAYRGGLLLHNDGGRRFHDATPHSGIRPQPWGTSCAWVDTDNDGRLDLYIGDYVDFGPHTQAQLCNFAGVMSACGPTSYAPLRGVLYHNEGAGHFRDITRAWGATAASGRCLGVACSDYDNSGRQSIALTNDETPGDLLHNLGNRFENTGIQSGTAYDAHGKAHGGMGVDWGDYDNDGRLDLAVGTFIREPDCVYHNDGGGVFSERSAILGLGEATTPYVTFGLKWIDYDNDGWLDLAVANGHIEDNVAAIDQTTTFRQPAQLFHNDHGRELKDVSRLAGQGFQKPMVGRGLAIGDYDNDGKMDLLIVDSDGAPRLLHNEAAAGHWLSVRLEGRRCNRDGIGAIVTASAGGLTQTRLCTTGGSYLSASDRRVHFGLGTADAVDRLTVRWPDGTLSTLARIPANRQITVLELPVDHDLAAVR